MIRLAKNEDIEELVNMRIEQQKDDWREQYEDKFDLYKVTYDYMKIHLNKDLITLVYEIDSNIVASCSMQIIKYLPQCNDNGIQGWICNVFTKKEERGKGIQTKLLKKILQIGTQYNIMEFSLRADITQENGIAIHIYKKLGFDFDKDAMLKRV